MTLFRVDTLICVHGTYLFALVTWSHNVIYVCSEILRIDSITTTICYLKGIISCVCLCISIAFRSHLDRISHAAHIHCLIQPLKIFSVYTNRSRACLVCNNRRVISSLTHDALRCIHGGRPLWISLQPWSLCLVALLNNATLHRTQQSIMSCFSHGFRFSVYYSPASLASHCPTKRDHILWCNSNLADLWQSMHIHWSSSFIHPKRVPLVSLDYPCDLCLRTVLCWEAFSARFRSCPKLGVRAPPSLWASTALIYTSLVYHSCIHPCQLVQAHVPDGLLQSHLPTHH